MKKPGIEKSWHPITRENRSEAKAFASARIRYRQTTGASHQIYHLEDSTRLKTLELVLGYDFTL